MKHAKNYFCAWSDIHEFTDIYYNIKEKVAFLFWSWLRLEGKQKGGKCIMHQMIFG